MNAPVYEPGSGGRLQKALTEMNLQLHRVISDITGTTGMAIIRAIVSGERDPHKLASFKDGRIKASKQEIAAALTGDYRPELVFILHQELQLYEVTATSDKPETGRGVPRGHAARTRIARKTEQSKAKRAKIILKADENSDWTDAQVAGILGGSRERRRGSPASSRTGRNSGLPPRVLVIGQ